MFSVHTSRRFNSFGLKSVRKAPFSVDNFSGIGWRRRLDPRNKASFLNFSAVVWTGPETNLQHKHVQSKKNRLACTWARVQTSLFTCPNVNFKKSRIKNGKFLWNIRPPKSKMWQKSHLRAATCQNSHLGKNVFYRFPATAVSCFLGGF